LKKGAHATFIATQLLAKHDENYMPPNLAKALKAKTPHKDGTP
jgi:cytochrome c-type biogenesis protein CcmE